MSEYNDICGCFVFINIFLCGRCLWVSWRFSHLVVVETSLGTRTRRGGCGLPRSGSVRLLAFRFLRGGLSSPIISISYGQRRGGERVEAPFGRADGERSDR